MTPETFEALRTGSDKRHWLVIGGPHDRERIAPYRDAHLCLWRMIPRQKNGSIEIEYVVYRIDHDNHILEFDPAKNLGFVP